MSAKLSLDYIIVGQGLAGSALALKLLKLKKRILVIDSPAKNTSSMIAAGLFNPITGRKMVKTWLADKLFPALHTHYQEAAALCGNTFFHPMPLYRPFISIEEQNEWMGRSSDSSFTSYIDSVTTGPTAIGVSDPFGGLRLKQCGYLDTRAYIECVRNMLNESQSYLENELVESDFEITPDSVVFKGLTASRVVFCNGTHTNAWFGWLPILPLKGEALVVEAELPHDLIVNRGVYVVPAGTNWRVGATYNYNDTSGETTEKSRTELEGRFRELVKLPYQVLDQEWGIRPTTPDRRPMLGRHPEFEAVWIFNGMGTKGVSLAPYFADVLIRSMENGEPLNKEVDIERFKLLYWSSPR